MAYLIKYDTVYGRYERDVEAADGALVVDGEPISYLSERDPARLPWSDLGVELVFECTGLFTKQEDASKHIEAGARWVILSGPTSSVDVPTVVHGVNRPSGGTSILSCASCTTNNITPVVEVLHRHFGVEKALLTTIHAYTATQAIVDSPGHTKDFRRGRAAAANFVPASTGAAIAPSRSVRSRTSCSCSVGRLPLKRSTPPCERRQRPSVIGRSSASPKIRLSPATSWGIRGRQLFSST
jgi:glyceraldehyde 3-phosphate dehydrogenase